eukprot:scaffold88967_cov53-Attheya_sp.AAC.1
MQQIVLSLHQCNPLTWNRHVWTAQSTSMSKASFVVVGGRLLRGIPRMVVIPPAAAARVHE